jgi:arabinofuranosyltransferase
MKSFTKSDNLVFDIIQKIVLAASVIALAYGIYRVIELWWVCDDAFISFRYAKNLVEGHGLVFNVGERVEGYTNFLWTVIISLGMLLNLDPLPFSVVLGGIAYVFTVLLAAYVSHRLFKTDNSGRRAFFVPAAALSLLVLHDYHVFATSGLETSWVAALITLGFALLIFADTGKTVLFAGLALVAAAMSRPDALLFYVIAIPFVILIGKPYIRNLVMYLLPGTLVYLPYWILRYLYYGYPFPNTYYAKSANLPYYDQGLAYLGLFLKSYYVLYLVPVALVAVIVVYRRRLTTVPLCDPVSRAIVLAAIFIAPYTLYVVRSGGDFMFARFWIPILPVTFLFLEVSLRSFITRYRFAPLVLLVIPLAVFFRWNPYTEVRQINGIAYEPDYYPRYWVQHAREAGSRMREIFEGQDVRVAFYGMYAVYVYYSEVPTAIESNAGLTDPFVAHLPIVTRGRPGHEKQAPMPYLLERGVNFAFRGWTPLISLGDTLTHISFGDFNAGIIVYKKELMDYLKQYKDVRFVDLPLNIDEYLGHLSSEPEYLVRQDYAFFKELYFDHNNDSIRETPIRNRLGLGPK